MRELPLSVLLPLLLLAQAAQAAAPGARDPDWPCQQIKMPEMSLAAAWNGPPVDPATANWRADAEVAELVRKITPRRVSLKDAKAAIHEFAQRAGGQKQQKLLSVLAGAFSVLDNERGSVIAGLDRFGARQKQLAAEIRADNEKLAQERAGPQQDEAAQNKLVEQITWEAQVFQDRRQALSYACDVPNRIEQRWYALAQAIREELGAS